MNAPKKFVEVIDGLKYDTSEATLIADDAYYDGNSYERGGRNHFLYRTEDGRYFLVVLTQRQGERDYLQPITETAAKKLYINELFERPVSYDAAFPNRRKWGKWVRGNGPMWVYITFED